MIESGDIRKGMTVEMDGALYKILDFKHIKIGRGSAQVRLKLRNITEGHTIERTFQAGERFAVARLERAQKLRAADQDYLGIDRNRLGAQRRRRQVDHTTHRCSLSGLRHF